MPVLFRPRHLLEIPPGDTACAKHRRSITLRRGPSATLAIVPALATAAAVYISLALMENFTRATGSPALPASEDDQRVRALDRLQYMPATATRPPPSPPDFSDRAPEASASSAHATPRPQLALEPESAAAKISLPPVQLEPLRVPAVFATQPQEAVAP